MGRSEAHHLQAWPMKPPLKSSLLSHLICELGPEDSAEICKAHRKENGGPRQKEPETLNNWEEQNPDH